jgi:protein-tyrosine-phosphatase
VRSVLFVCSANICRSPMAMGLLLNKVKLEADKWKIHSAGVWALVDHAVDKNVQLVLQDRGIAELDHRSTQVTEELLSYFNLILTMEKTHKEVLGIAFPMHRSRVYLLTEMINETADIVDPIGGSRLDFEATAKELDDILTRGLERIKKLACLRRGEIEDQ